MCEVEKDSAVHVRTGLEQLFFGLYLRTRNGRFLQIIRELQEAGRPAASEPAVPARAERVRIRREGVHAY